MKTYNVYGKIEFYINDYSLEVKANSEQEAIKKGIVILNDLYHLDRKGMHHDPSVVDFSGLEAEIDDFADDEK